MAKYKRETGDEPDPFDPLPPVDEEELKLRLSEMRLVGRAVRERWPITPETRALLGSRLGTLVKTTTSQRQLSRAAKTLLAMDQLNQRDEHHEVEATDTIKAAAEFRAARAKAESEGERGGDYAP